MNNYEENFSHQINIDVDNIKIECEKFLSNLIEDVKKFKEDFNNYKIKFNSIKNKKSENIENILYTPEAILNSSPITLINAPWGSGKTFFIESLCEYILTGEIKLKYINKIIVIDAWKYSASTLIPNDFVNHLIDKLASGYKKRKKIKKTFYSFLNSVPLAIINNKLGIDIKIDEKNNLSVEDSIDTLNKYINKPVLVVLDNIERIGSSWWDVIKIIQKLVVLENFIFLLPVYREKLQPEGDSEWSIDKYVSIPIYNIKTNYDSVLKDYFDKKYLQELKYILNININGECLNLRQLNNLLNKHFRNIVFSNKYEMLYKFKKYIWNPIDNTTGESLSLVDELIEQDVKDLADDCQAIVTIHQWIQRNYKEFNLEKITVDINGNTNHQINRPIYKCFTSEIKNLLKIINESFNKLKVENRFNNKNKEMLDWFKSVESKLLDIEKDKDKLYLNNAALEIKEEYLKEEIENTIDNITTSNNIYIKYTYDWAKIVREKITSKLNNIIKFR